MIEDKKADSQQNERLDDQREALLSWLADSL